MRPGAGIVSGVDALNKEAIMETSTEGKFDTPGEQGALNHIHLTKREIEVLTLVIEGNSSQATAEHIYISKRTVDFHLANIYQKLHVKNRVQAFREATRRNLLPLTGDFGVTRS